MFPLSKIKKNIHKREINLASCSSKYIPENLPEKYNAVTKCNVYSSIKTITLKTQEFAYLL